MNLLKQNWFKVTVGAVILSALFFFIKGRNDSPSSKFIISEKGSPMVTSLSTVDPNDSTCLSYQEYPLFLKFDSKIEVNHDDKGYYIDVPSLNESVCVWRYKAGIKSFSYLETTRAEHSQHHSFALDAFACTDLSVLCFTDDGKNYLGIFKQ